ncbi:hypothetical protein D3C77_245360 [compost metagenome]
MDARADVGEFGKIERRWIAFDQNLGQRSDCTGVQLHQNGIRVDVIALASGDLVDPLRDVFVHKPAKCLNFGGCLVIG